MRSQPPLEMLDVLPVGYIAWTGEKTRAAEPHQTANTFRKEETFGENTNSTPDVSNFKAALCFKSRNQGRIHAFCQVSGVFHSCAQTLADRRNMILLN